MSEPHLDRAEHPQPGPGAGGGPPVGEVGVQGGIAGFDLLGDLGGDLRGEFGQVLGGVRGFVHVDRVGFGQHGGRFGVVAVARDGLLGAGGAGFVAELVPVAAGRIVDDGHLRVGEVVAGGDEGDAAVGFVLGEPVRDQVQVEGRHLDAAGVGEPDLASRPVAGPWRRGARRLRCGPSGR